VAGAARARPGRRLSGADATASASEAPLDLRGEILRAVAGATVAAAIVADEAGLVAGAPAAARAADELGLALERLAADGSRVGVGDELARFHGPAERVLAAEDRLIGLLAKSSGIATAARAFVERAGSRPRIVSGAWKKMPPCQKQAVRSAVEVGGAAFRITSEPFVYLDKNYVRVLGGIRASLEAVGALAGHKKVVQIKGRHAELGCEALEAAQAGADILHVDTGRPEDIERVSAALRRAGCRGRVEIAFGGNLRLEQVDALRRLDVDILDVGRRIVDAPLLDMRMEVLG